MYYVLNKCFINKGIKKLWMFKMLGVSLQQDDGVCTPSPLHHQKLLKKANSLLETEKGVISLPNTSRSLSPRHSYSDWIDRERKAKPQIPLLVRKHCDQEGI